MKIVYKYAFFANEIETYFLPEGAEILDIKMQNGGFQLWALVDPEAKEVPRLFCTVGTGHPLPKPDEYDFTHLKTLMLYKGKALLHVFEAVKHGR